MAIPFFLYMLLEHSVLCSSVYVFHIQFAVVLCTIVNYSVIPQKTLSNELSFL